VKEKQAEKINLWQLLIEQLTVALAIFILLYAAVMAAELLIKDHYPWQVCAPYGFLVGFLTALFTKVRYLSAMMVAVLSILIIAANNHLDQPYSAITAMGVAFGAQLPLYYKLLKFYRMKVTLMRSKEFWKEHKKKTPRK